ncbi:hypothetical protein K4K61_012051 [Colletotrichum sp. SAR11_59]|nr:hypothetical protein K4K61_012051 [Colletotrichum sp. SAR11_59]
MFNIEPVQRDTMESCLGTLIKTADDRRPKDKDVMMCSCEKWSVFYQNQKSENFTAHLAVYRDSYQDILIVNPNQQRQEGIHIDLDVEGRKDLLGHATYPRVRFSPAGFFELENTNEEKALRFDSLHSDYTLYFAKVDQYHRFITLMTRQEIVGNIKDPPGVGRDFLVGSCKINKGKTLYEDGTLQLWKLLPEDKYDKEFARTCPASSSGGVSTITWSRHPSETRLTPFKLILWTRSQSYHRKACLIVDIGEDTWELEVDKKDTSCLKIGRKHIYTNAFRNQQLRAAIFYEEQDPSGRTDERYPYVPIDPVELQKTLQQGVVKDMDIHFKSPKGKSHHNAKAS